MNPLSSVALTMKKLPASAYCVHIQKQELKVINHLSIMATLYSNKTQKHLIPCTFINQQHQQPTVPLSAYFFSRNYFKQWKIIFPETIEDYLVLYYLLNFLSHLNNYSHIMFYCYKESLQILNKIKVVILLFSNLFS